MNNARELIEPRSMLGINFNIRDQQKFSQAIQLLRESANGLPIFAADNTIVWNQNLSFPRDEYFINLLNGSEFDDIEKSCIWRLYVLLYFAETCENLEGDFVELGCHKGSTAKRVTEKINFSKNGKRYWLYDLFNWSEGDEHTHMPGHDNPNMFEDVVKRFSEQSYVSIIKGSVPDSFEQGFPDKIALGLDAKDGYLSLSGWKENSNQLTLDYLKGVNDYGVSRLIYTDINRDGMKQSPNFEETTKIAEISNCQVIISGGVSSIEDIKKAKKLNNSNIEGIIVGKAIYDGDIKLDELAKEIDA